MTNISFFFYFGLLFYSVPYSIFQREAIWFDKKKKARYCVSNVRASTRPMRVSPQRVFFYYCVRRRLLSPRDLQWETSMKKLSVWIDRWRRRKKTLAKVASLWKLERANQILITLEISQWRESFILHPSLPLASLVKILNFSEEISQWSEKIYSLKILNALSRDVVFSPR